MFVASTDFGGQVMGAPYPSWYKPYLLTYGDIEALDITLCNVSVASNAANSDIIVNIYTVPVGTPNATNFYEERGDFTVLREISTEGCHQLSVPVRLSAGQNNTDFQVSQAIEKNTVISDMAVHINTAAGGLVEFTLQSLSLTESGGQWTNSTFGP